MKIRSLVCARFSSWPGEATVVEVAFQRDFPKGFSRSQKSPALSRLPRGYEPGRRESKPGGSLRLISPKRKPLTLPRQFSQLSVQKEWGNVVMGARSWRFASQMLLGETERAWLGMDKIPGSRPWRAQMLRAGPSETPYVKLVEALQILIRYFFAFFRFLSIKILTH